MSVKLGFNHYTSKVAISSITVEDLDVVEHEVTVLEEFVSFKSKQLEDHASMLDSVKASIAQMEAEEHAKIIAEERLHLENAQLLEDRATHLSNEAISLDAEVADVEKELSSAVEVQLEIKLDLDIAFADWYKHSEEYFHSQTVYTQASILQSNLPEITQKQESSIILAKELALDESARVLLDIIQESSSASSDCINNWYDELEVLKEKALSYGLYSSNNPGEIIKRLNSVEEALWKLEQNSVKGEIEALVIMMESKTKVDKDTIRDFREEIKSLQDDAKEYNVYTELLYAWQVLDSIKPVEMQEAENQRHARMLANKQEALVREEEHKAHSVMSHAFNEARDQSEG